MKFSSSLKFNAVAEWWDEYIAYEALKKHLYQLEKQKAGLHEAYHDLEANERTSLMGSGPSASDLTNTDAFFIPLLDRELKKVCMFYEMEEQRLSDEVKALQQEVERQEENGPYAGHQFEDEEDADEEDEEDDEFDLHSPVHDRTQSPARQRRRHSRSVSSAGPGAPSGSRRKLDSKARRYSVSSDEQDDMEASTMSLDPNMGLGRGSSKSPLVRARNLASKLKDSIMSTSSAGPETVWTARNKYAWDMQLLFKRKITNLYVLATSLRSYVELNYAGFRKILKKYDKVMESNLQDRYLHDVVEQAAPFQQASKDKLNNTISLLTDLYARCVTHGDPVEARRQLKLHQREHIAWERDTVWRQMINQARRGEDGAGMMTMGGSLIVEPEPEKGLLNVQTPAGRVKLTTKQLYLVAAIVIFTVLLNIDYIDGAEANKCFAILVFATILWATEAIPLFVTSTFIPFLLVVSRVIRDADGNTLPAPAATKHVFSVMFSPTIMLLIGGFTIASALSKTAIDRVIITRILSLAGERPSTVLLAFMGVACFASMWISNVAAPTLCFTLIQPILRTLPPKSSFAPCLIIGIALAANIGGQSSPISSPQNLIAIGFMEPQLDWGSWFAVSLPVSAISIVLIWLLLLVSYRPARSPTGDGDIEIKPLRAPRERFTAKQWWVTFVCLLTIALWCVAHSIQDYIGDMGVIAIIPIVLLFSTGVLKKDDFDQFLWTVVFIAMGGIALGNGVTNSGLLEVLGDGIRDLISGMDLYPVVLLLSLIVLVISTFISHTIASVLLVPIAKEVGKNMPGGDYSNLLIFITGLICSTGMGMPVSGFPNQTAATQEDEMGQLYLSNVDFLKNGVPASIIAAMVVATVGYLLMRAIGV
ncbi:Sodium/sulfate symporter [Polyporus arcularius HHB13444]|uniref:Sodium/sulfate symporter n=1 Tax=Polyporus arcularius HHB13444 TaxID=1314778 RepID=A0A5C3PW83_9APHY|nr:Sodium/sulfate symporter [Polyporus arcularius HHB13444]